MVQFRRVVERLWESGIDPAQQQTAEGHAQDQTTAEPVVAMALQGQHVAAVELCKQSDHSTESDQIQKIDRQKFQEGREFALHLKSDRSIQSSRAWTETEVPQNVSPGVGGEGGDDHQQQHHRPGRVKQFLDGVDEAADGCAEHCCDPGPTAGGDDDAPEGDRSLQPTRHLPGHGTTHLHGRSLRTEWKAAADCDDAGDQFHKAHPQAHGH